MKLKDIWESSMNFSESVRKIEDFFCNDHQHLKYFVNLEDELKEVKYTLLCVDGIIVRYSTDKEYECVIPWEEFLKYLYHEYKEKIEEDINNKEYFSKLMQKIIKGETLEEIFRKENNDNE